MSNHKLKLFKIYDIYDENKCIKNAMLLHHHRGEHINNCFLLLNEYNNKVEYNYSLDYIKTFKRMLYCMDSNINGLYLTFISLYYKLDGLNNQGIQYNFVQRSNRSSIRKKILGYGIIDIFNKRQPEAGCTCVSCLSFRSTFGGRINVR